MFRRRPLIRSRRGGDSLPDYEAFCAIASAAGLDFPVEAAQLRARDEAYRAEGATIDYWFACPAGNPAEVLGASTAFTLLRYGAQGRRFVDLGVHPDAEGQGIARALASHVLEDLRAQGARELLAKVSDRSPRGLELAQQLGFEPVAGEVDCELTIDLAGRDLEALEPLIRRVEAGGIRFETLAKLKGHVPDWFERVYRLWTALDRLVPTALDHTTPSPEAFWATELEWPGALPEAYFIALDGDRWVGLSELRHRQGARYPLFVGLTGVLPSHQGRGVATALKLLGLRWAQSAGYRYLHTQNAAENIAMLKANQRVGFELGARWHTLRFAF